MIVNAKNDNKTPSGYKVSGRSKAELRQISKGVRKILLEEDCYKNDGKCVDAVYLLENLLHRAQYNFHLVDDSLLPETVAFTVPGHQLIVLRESIYEGLFKDDPFARFTVVHEFSHIVLEHDVNFHRGASLGQHNWYEDSEWQANNLAAELLMPVEVIKRLKARPIFIMSECGVSEQAANFRLQNLKTEGVI
jgi:hypothetical protein